jgi:WD40 repeat protein
VAWSPDGKYIACGDTGGYLRVCAFNGTVGSLLPTQILVQPSGRPINSLAWSPNGKFIAFGDFNVSGGNHIFLYVYSFSGTALTSVAVLDRATSGAAALYYRSVSWSPDGKYLAAAYTSASPISFLDLYSFNGGALTNIGFVANESIVFYSVAWSPDGKHLALGDAASVRVFNMISLSSFTSVSYPTGATVNKVAWSPDGRYLITADSGALVRVLAFNGNGAMSLTQLTNYATTSPASAVSWSANGKYMASGIATANCVVQTYRGMYGPANCLVDSCTVADTSAAGLLMGRGMVAGGTNVFLSNIASNNGVNYSYGIPNVYDGRFEISRLAVQPFDNISMPTTL